MSRSDRHIGDTTQADDWQLEEIDWSEDAGHATPGSASAARVGLVPASGSEPGPRPAEHDGPSALVRRRRIVALAAVGLVIVLALVIPLVVFGGGGGSAEPTTVPTITTTPATGAEQPATTTTTTTPATTTQPESSGAKPLRVVLPENGSLHRGSSGSSVTQLQKGLAALGYATGEPDGTFGQVTEAAVIDFQRSNNLDPDGIAGTDTVRLLNAALAKRAVTG